jgi:hypothetical protein
LEVGGKGCAVKGTRLEAIRAEVRSQKSGRGKEAKRLEGKKGKRR